MGFTGFTIFNTFFQSRLEIDAPVPKLIHFYASIFYFFKRITLRATLNSPRKLRFIFTSSEKYEDNHSYK